MTVKTILNRTTRLIKDIVMGGAVLRCLQCNKLVPRGSMVKHCRHTKDHVSIPVYQARNRTNSSPDLVSHPHRPTNNNRRVAEGTSTSTDGMAPAVDTPQIEDDFVWQDMDVLDERGVGETDEQRHAHQLGDMSLRSEPYFGAGNNVSSCLITCRTTIYFGQS